MSKNENKRLMREKNDTCIKSYQLANTMFLNGEEFAAVIRKAMIVDDVNNKRYIDIDDDLKSTYQSYEKKWLDEFDMLAKKNPLVLQAYLSIRGQTKKSRQSFNDLQGWCPFRLLLFLDFFSLQLSIKMLFFSYALISLFSIKYERGIFHTNDKIIIL